MCGEWRYGSGMPDENSFDEETPPAAEWLRPFWAKKIIRVIRTIATETTSLMIERRPPYKARSRGE